MNQTFRIDGMTCQNCKKSVEEKLSQIVQVTSAEVDLMEKTAKLVTSEPLSVKFIADHLPSKYSVSSPEISSALMEPSVTAEKSKLVQLKPLFIIFFYITGASLLLNWSDFSWSPFMLDFMGLFFIVFSFFKLLDLKGFPESFAMYDPLAAAVPAYGWIYPFLETALGLAFLMRYQTEAALWITLVILGITTVGVLRTLLSKKKIQCACLGTALKLPMTQATLIENCLMLVMAIMLLTKML